MFISNIAFFFFESEFQSPSILFWTICFATKADKIDKLFKLILRNRADNSTKHFPINQLTGPPILQ